MGTKYAVEHFLEAYDWDAQTRNFKLSPAPGRILQLKISITRARTRSSISGMASPFAPGRPSMPVTALMNNPVGNVALWWNQVDYYGLENPKTDKSDHKTNYMGIIQWPQALANRWNLVNRVVYNVTRSLVDQDEVDEFGSTQDAIVR